MTFGKNLWGQKVKYFPMILQRTSIKNQAKKLFLETGKIAAAMKYVWIKRDPCSALYEILMILKILLRSTKNAFIMQSHSRILDRSSTPIWSPRKIFQGRNYSGRMTNFPSTMCFVSSRSRVLRFAFRLGVLLCRVWPSQFAFGVLSCRILDSSSLFIFYVYEHDRLGSGVSTVETAVSHCNPVATETFSLIRSNINL